MKSKCRLLDGPDEIDNNVSRQQLFHTTTEFLQRSKTPPMSLLDIWGIFVDLRNVKYPSLSLLSGPPYPGVVAPDKARSMG